MKRLLGFVLVGLLAGAPSAWAVAERTLPSPEPGTFETTWYTSAGTDGVSATSDSLGSFGKNSIIYGYSIFAKAAGGGCTLQDAATYTAGSTTQGIFIDEALEGTDEERQDPPWPAPYRLVTDLSVGCTSALLVIYHAVQ